MYRRDFLKIVGGTAAALSIPNPLFSFPLKDYEKRPNILWIVTEDINDDLSCYGDKYSYTPNLDKLASEGIRFTNIYDHSGVCAPTRSGIITCMYPTTMGSGDMRCSAVPPAEIKCFTEYLRAAGYYCTNNDKTDYNFKTSPDVKTETAAPASAWDNNGSKAHWRNRDKDQPFFSVINIFTTHESQIRVPEERFQKNIAHVDSKNLHKRKDAVLPPYYPDTPVVRNDWAKYYDLITAMDIQVKEILDQLKEDNLEDDTIVFFYGDNGRGLPRAKRWIYDSGIKMGLLVRWPKHFKPGSINDDLVEFIDLGATVLSLAGVDIPEHFQGIPFLGESPGKKREYIFAARDRMDERYDIIRAVRDKKFKYIRNFMPFLPYAQNIEYMDQMPTMKEMRRLNAEGKLNDVQKLFFRDIKPLEELYDITADPYEINNLADKSEYAETLLKMRNVLHNWMIETEDTGLIPEPVLDSSMRPQISWEKTGNPYVSYIKKNSDYFEIKVDCETEGASIVYNIGNNKNWKLFSKKIKVKNNKTLKVKANRLGFDISDTVSFIVNKNLKVSPVKEKSNRDWKENFRKGNLFKRLLTIKNLDFLPDEESLPNLYRALEDKSDSIRYWAVLGIHYKSHSAEQISKAKKYFESIINDDSPVIRIASAHALCDWNEGATAIPVLIKELENQLESVRLHAAIALDSIGDKIKPYSKQIKKMLKPNAGDNDQKVLRHAVEGLS
ncbi:MAG: sulfatase-like hydrolase/transferase [Ignavibacteriaceae bacterium]|jgi:N-sulfoglucosamine sulfohydrolase